MCLHPQHTPRAFPLSPPHLLHLCEGNDGEWDPHLQVWQQAIRGFRHFHATHSCAGLLGDLMLMCPHNCGEVLQMKHLHRHLKASCTTMITPPLSNVSVQQLLDLPPGSALETAALGKLVDKFVPSSGSFTQKSSTGKVHLTAATIIIIINNILVHYYFGLLVAWLLSCAYRGVSIFISVE
ncbi:MAG: hypothetical protein A6F71_09550 [Cycloclasticus sp. symbiont of Poecilosclerida sp. M]|nr:MAG: hypothetical protein A6F71_09550 [Cycloclasticus sp. symbiont of Poecilosclerida sp. M]